MRALQAALALGLLLSSLLPGNGLSLESLLTNKRCKCVKVTAQVIGLGLILAIDVTPPVKVWSLKVCVAPEAPWIQLLIHKLTQRDVTKKEVAAVARSRGEAGRQPPAP
uniref:Chemokine interleukin-8-like domain-containing protein n=1 Tax=Phasianus colchicus TaxID=9054 RepID=A0A669QHI1_PHACC